jgi:multiple sugar transport system substrate-binding protein
MGLYIANTIINNTEVGSKIEKITILSNQYFRFTFSKQKKSKGKILKMLTLISPSSDALKNLAPEFEKATGIELQITALPYNDLHNHVSLLNKDYYFDLVRMDVAMLREFGEDIYQELKESEDLDKILYFLENDSLKFFTRIKNRVYSLPFDPSVQILLYRKDLFEDAYLQRAYYEMYRDELKVPNNFEDYNKIAKFFTKELSKKSPTKYGSTITFGSPVVAACDFMPRFLAETDGIIQDKNGDLNHDALEKSLTSYLENYDYAIKDNNSWWKDSTQEFAKGNVAMTIVFSNHASYIADSKLSEVAGRVGGAIIPGSRPLVGGGVIGISKFSPQIDECMEFFKWFYNTDVTSALTLLGGSSPNFKEVEDFDLLSIYPWISVINESFNLGTRSLTQDSTKNITLSQFENIIGSAVRNIVNKNMNIEEALRFIEVMYSTN